MNQFRRTLAILLLVIIVLVPLASSMGPTHQQPTVVFEEKWYTDPLLRNWETTGDIAMVDCATWKDLVCSLRVDPQSLGQANMVRVERDVNHQMGFAPYEISFWFRNGEIHGWTEHWFHVDLPGGDYVRLELTYGTPNGRVALNTTYALTPVFATYPSDVWHQAIIIIDPVEHTARAEVRDANNDLKGASFTTPLAATVTHIGRVSFLSKFTGTDLLNDKPHPMHYDTLRITTTHAMPEE